MFCRIVLLLSTIIFNVALGDAEREGPVTVTKVWLNAPSCNQILYMRNLNCRGTTEYPSNCRTTVDIETLSAHDSRRCFRIRSGDCAVFN